MFEDTIATTEFAVLLSLRRRDARTGAVVDVGLLDPLIERRVGDAKVPRDLGHGSLVQTGHFDHVVTELLGVALCHWTIFPQRPCLWKLDVKQIDSSAGFSSLGELVHLVSDWTATARGDSACIRLVFGAEPFTSTKHEFRSVRAEFTDIAREYWLEEQGISLRSSAQVLQTIEALERGLLSAQFIHGSHRLHAKIFVGENAATVGSSNFTRNGLGDQYEANARFDATHEPKRYRELVAIAENYWAAGESWDDELRQLLHQLLRVVSWEEALARACANLLEGDWASRYLAEPSSVDRPLWPSQRSGIAEALWISETVGSVLVADATGSGKTLMGAHLVRAARDRLWRTGRARRDLTVLVGPPAVIGTWKSEAIQLGLMLEPVSHGILSRAASDLKSDEGRLVRSAQILAVDEAHNFLSSAAR